MKYNGSPTSRHFSRVFQLPNPSSPRCPPQLASGEQSFPEAARLRDESTSRKRRAHNTPPLYDVLLKDGANYHHRVKRPEKDNGGVVIISVEHYL